MLAPVNLSLSVVFFGAACGSVSLVVFLSPFSLLSSLKGQIAVGWRCAAGSVFIHDSQIAANHQRPGGDLDKGGLPWDP